MKECKHCKLEIQDQARLCQHCKGFQNWVATQQDPRILVVSLSVLVVIVAIGLGAMIVFSDRPHNVPVLHIIDHTHRFVSAPDGNHLFVLGNVNNTSDADATDIWFRVTLTASDKLLDEVLIPANGLIVKARTTETFRLTSVVAPASDEVTQVRVTTYRARGLRK